MPRSARIPFWLLVTAVFASLPANSCAQNSNDKVLEKLSVKDVEREILKFGEDGYVPMDGAISGKGRRTKFDVRLSKPVREIKWYMNFGLTIDDFERRFEEKKLEGYRVAWHDTYVVSRKVLHACIWHADGTYDPPTKEELLDRDNRPAPIPVGTIWEPESNVPAQSKGDATFAELEANIISYMRANQMPALSAAVAIKGKVAYEGTFGFSNLEKRLPIQFGQPIRISSLSRLITVVATLKLVDRGKLQLDQPIYPLLDVEPMNPATVDDRLKDITVLHLLQETGGHDNGAVIEPGFQPRFLEAVFKQKGELISPDQAISYMMSQPLAFEPGEKRSDSSWGYFLLARAIEKVSGVSYEEFVLKNIARPLKMRSLRMSRSDPDARSPDEIENVHRAGNWFPKITGKDTGKWVQLNRGGYHFGLLDGSQGWMATASDMLKLGLAIQAKRSPILSEQAKLVLVSKPTYVLEQEKLEGKPKILWKGCSMYCQKTSRGITLSLECGEASGSAGLVLHSTREVAFCYLFNCADTAEGRHPKSGFDPIVRNETYRLHDLLNRK